MEYKEDPSLEVIGSGEGLGVSSNSTLEQQADAVPAGIVETTLTDNKGTPANSTTSDNGAQTVHDLSYYRMVT